MPERPHQRLIAWQEAYSLSRLIYALTKKFPAEEKFGLVDQMRRASSSVPINLAEGNSKRTAKHKATYFDIAHASLNEVHCEALLAKDLEYLTQQEFDDIDDRTARVSYLLLRLRSSLFK